MPPPNILGRRPVNTQHWLGCWWLCKQWNYSLSVWHSPSAMHYLWLLAIRYCTVHPTFPKARKIPVAPKHLYYGIAFHLADLFLPSLASQVSLKHCCTFQIGTTLAKTGFDASLIAFRTRFRIINNIPSDRLSSLHYAAPTQRVSTRQSYRNS